VDVPAAGTVSEAVDTYVNALNLNARERVLAETAKTLGRKLDACGSSDAAAAAQAAPRLAQQLVDVIEVLRGSAPREPDLIDELKARMSARRAVVAGSVTA
jgi:hypothetical protein